MPQVTIETARRIEELADELCKLAEGTDLIAPNFLSVVAVIKRNAVARFHKNEMKKPVRK